MKFNFKANTGMSPVPIFLIGLLAMGYLLRLSFQYDIEKPLMLRVSTLCVMVIILYGIMQTLINKGISDTYIKVASISLFSFIALTMLITFISSSKIDFNNFVNVSKAMAVLFISVVVVLVASYLLITTYKVSSPLFERVIARQQIENKKVKAQLYLTDQHLEESLNSARQEFEKAKKETAKKKSVQEEVDEVIQRKEREGYYNDKNNDPLERVRILINNWLIDHSKTSSFTQKDFAKIMSDTKVTQEQLNGCINKHFYSYNVNGTTMFTELEKDEFIKELQGAEA